MPLNEASLGVENTINPDSEKSDQKPKEESKEKSQVSNGKKEKLLGPFKSQNVTRGSLLDKDKRAKIAGTEMSS